MNESTSKATATPILAGWGAADITPAQTVELVGQYYQRVATSVRDPIGVTALAIERAGTHGGAGQAVLVSCDQPFVDRSLVEELRERLRTLLPDLDPSRLVVSTTHTHCAPAASDPLEWWEHDPALLSTEEFSRTLMRALETAVSQAWRSRKPASLGAAAAYASVGHCRRTLYADGSAEMYGSTDRPDFVGMEGGEDDTVGVVATWDPEGALTGLLVNVACPSQVMEATYSVTADMFGELRRRLRERYGDGLQILCHVGAAGDLSPRDLTRPFRGGPTYWDEPGMMELADRLAAAVSDALPRAEASRETQPVLLHEVLLTELPVRTVSPAAYARAAAELAALAAREPGEPTAPDSAYARFVARTRERERLGGPGPYDDKNDDFVLMRNLEAVLRRFRSQQDQPAYPAELHVLRLGNTAMCTSPFELYLDYALRVRARCPAALTLHVQLSADYAGYLPTERAVAAGGYGALVANGSVGPEGGRLLVETLVTALAAMFRD